MLASSALVAGRMKALAGVAKKGNSHRLCGLPISTVQERLNICLFFLLIYHAVEFPIRGSFFSLGERRHVGFVVIQTLIDLLFLAESALLYTTGTVTRYRAHDKFAGNMRATMAVIAVNTLSSMPYEIALLARPDATVVRRLAALKLLRLLRFPDISEPLRISFLHSDINHRLRSTVTLLCRLLFVTHLASCFWFLVACDSELGARARDEEDEELLELFRTRCGYENHLFSKYISAFYFSVATIFSLGYGDIRPSNVPERLVGILYEIIGALIFGLIIGQIQHILQTQDPTQHLRSARVGEIVYHAETLRLPDMLTGRVRQHFEYYYKSRTVFPQEDLLESLPMHLVDALIRHHYTVWIRRLFWFRRHVGTSVETTNGFRVYMLKLVAFLRPMRVPTGTLIVEQGDVSVEAYFLMSGLVEGFDNEVPRYLTGVMAAEARQLHASGRSAGGSARHSATSTGSTKSQRTGRPGSDATERNTDRPDRHKHLFPAPGNSHNIYNSNQQTVAGADGLPMSGGGGGGRVREFGASDHPATIDTPQQPSLFAGHCDTSAPTGTDADEEAEQGFTPVSAGTWRVGSHFGLSSTVLAEPAPLTWFTAMPSSLLYLTLEDIKITLMKEHRAKHGLKRAADLFAKRFPGFEAEISEGGGKGAHKNPFSGGGGGGGGDAHTLTASNVHLGDAVAPRGVRSWLQLKAAVAHPPSLSSVPGNKPQPESASSSIMSLGRSISGKLRMALLQSKGSQREQHRNGAASETASVTASKGLLAPDSTSESMRSPNVGPHPEGGGSPSFSANGEGPETGGGNTPSNPGTGTSGMDEDSDVLHTDSSASEPALRDAFRRKEKNTDSGLEEADAELTFRRFLMQEARSEREKINKVRASPLLRGQCCVHAQVLLDGVHLIDTEVDELGEPILAAYLSQVDANACDLLHRGLSSLSATSTHFEDSASVSAAVRASVHRAGSVESDSTGAGRKASSSTHRSSAESELSTSSMAARMNVTVGEQQRQIQLDAPSDVPPVSSRPQAAGATLSPPPGSSPKAPRATDSPPSAAGRRHGVGTLFHMNRAHSLVLRGSVHTTPKAGMPGDVTDPGRGSRTRSYTVWRAAMVAEEAASAPAVTKTGDALDGITEAEEVRATLDARWILPPDSALVQRWAVLMFCVGAYHLILSPFQISFAEFPLVGSFPFVELTFSLVILLDVALRLRTGYYEENFTHDKVLVVSPWMIFCKYACRGLLLLDLLSVLRVGVPRPVAYTALLLPCTHVFRTPQEAVDNTVADMAVLWHQVGWAGEVPSWAKRNVSLVFAILLLGHFVACAWYWAGVSGLFADSWVEEHDMDPKDDSVQRRYLTAFYWAVTTITTVGYGDIHALNDLERLITILFMLLGSTMVGYVVSSVSRFVSEGGVQKRLHETHGELIQHMRNYLRQQHVAPGLQREVMRHAVNLYRANNAFSSPILSLKMPALLRNHVVGFLHRDVLAKLPWLAGQKANAIMTLLNLMQPQLYQEKKLVYHPMLSPMGVYSVVMGTAEIYHCVHQGAKKDFVCTVGEGDSFGYTEYLLHGFGQYGVQASTDLYVYFLPDEHIAFLVQTFPHLAHSIRSMLEKMVMRRGMVERSKGLGKGVVTSQQLNKDGTVAAATGAVRSAAEAATPLPRTRSSWLGPSMAAGLPSPTTIQTLANDEEEHGPILDRMHATILDQLQARPGPRNSARPRGGLGVKGRESMAWRHRASRKQGPALGVSMSGSVGGVPAGAHRYAHAQMMTVPHASSGERDMTDQQSESELPSEMSEAEMTRRRAARPTLSIVAGGLPDAKDLAQPEGSRLNLSDSDAAPEVQESGRQQHGIWSDAAQKAENAGRALSGPVSDAHRTIGRRTSSSDYDNTTGSGQADANGGAETPARGQFIRPTDPGSASSFDSSSASPDKFTRFDMEAQEKGLRAMRLQRRNFVSSSTAALHPAATPGSPASASSMEPAVDAAFPAPISRRRPQRGSGGGAGAHTSVGPRLRAPRGSYITSDSSDQETRRDWQARRRRAARILAKHSLQKRVDPFEETDEDEDEDESGEMDAALPMPNDGSPTWTDDSGSSCSMDEYEQGASWIASHRHGEGRDEAPSPRLALANSATGSALDDIQRDLNVSVMDQVYRRSVDNTLIVQTFSLRQSIQKLVVGSASVVPDKRGAYSFSAYADPQDEETGAAGDAGEKQDDKNRLDATNAQVVAALHAATDDPADK